jgi:hypothetical protein
MGEYRERVRGLEIAKAARNIQKSSKILGERLGLFPKELITWNT